MAILTKAQLSSANSSSFPDNNSQQITPQILRDYNQSVIDTLVDSLDTGSFANTGTTNAFTQANNFTSISASQFVSASEFIGNGAKLTGITASVALPILDEGVLQGYATSLNFTGSTISASVVAGTAVINVTVDTASFVGVTAFNQYTSSTNSSISQLNASSASQQISINALNQYTASQSTASIVSSITQLNQFTSSANVRLTNLETTSASVNTSISNINQTTASQGVSITNLNQTTASINSSITQLNASSASQQVSINAINQATQSLQNKTGSYATTGSNTFSGNQIVSGTFAVTDGNDCRFQVGVTNNEISMTANGTNDINITFGGDLKLNGDIVALRNSIGDAQFITYNGTGVSQKAYSTKVTATGASGSYIISDVQNNKTYITVGGTAENVYVEAPLRVNAPLTASLSNGYVWVGNSSNVSTLVQTSSLASANTGSLLVTASASGSNITFTKGDASQFTITVATGSAISASYAETASLALNALTEIVNVKNTTGGQLNKGTIVRIIGATGDNPLIQTASWTDDITSANTLGWVTANIANDAFGTVITQGTLLGINTDPLLGYSAGQMLYLSSSGQYTNQKPDAPYHEVRLGQVLRAQQNNGSVYVSIMNGYELDELHDVDINTGSLANNDLLAWDSASQQWTNKTVTGVGALTTASFNSLTGSFATTGSNIFTGNQIINGVLSISSSATYDIDVTGSIQADNLIRVSGSAGIAQLSATGVLFQSSSLNSLLAGARVSSLSGSTSISITANPSRVGAAFNFASPVSNPSVVLATNVGTNYAPIQFQPAYAYTDGRTTFATPIAALSNVEITGSLTASLANGYVWVGDSNNKTSLVATSSFGSTINTGSFATTGSNTFIGNQNITGSLTISSSAQNDLIISGAAKIIDENGNITINGSGISALSATSNYGATFSSNVISNFNNSTFDEIGFTSDPVGYGITNGVGNTIYVNDPTDSFPAIINFQNKANWTDGRVTFTKPISALSNVEITGSLTASLANGYTYVGNASNKTTLVATSSFGQPIPAGTISSSAQITALGFVSSSITASSIVTASVSLNTITFTKGDASTFTLTVNTGSGGGGAAFPYTGSALITGSLGITGSLNGLVNTLSIASNTASLDFTQGNFFTLQLVSGSITHLTATNIIAGQTINLLVKTASGSAAASGSLTFSPTFKFAGGIDYTPTAITASQDLVSFVTFDTTQVFAGQIKNLS